MTKTSDSDTQFKPLTHSFGNFVLNAYSVLVTAGKAVAGRAEKLALVETEIHKISTLDAVIHVVEKRLGRTRGGGCNSRRRRQARLYPQADK